MNFKKKNLSRALIKRAVISLVLMQGITAFGQEQETEKKPSVKLPDIAGYHTLKCDFHMHTVFSDGDVWPTLRVTEAIRDGLDAISVTEHIDFEGFPDEIQKNYNKSFEIASDAAKNKNIIIIPGVEISPRVPPYHNNALFVKDANKFPIGYVQSSRKKFIMKPDATHDQLIAPFIEAKRQQAFVIYNHPTFSWWDKKDTSLFTSFHKELLDRKILSGIEVANSNTYNVLAHKLAMKYNLTMFCNTDAHNGLPPREAGSHRPMTLVFAKERSAEGIREALDARRTALYFDDYIVARQPEAEAFFKASVLASSQKKERRGEKILEVSLKNISDIPFRIKASADYDIERYPLGQVTLSPHKTTTLILKELWKYPDSIPLRVEVLNVLVSPDESLKSEFKLIPGR